MGTEARDTPAVGHSLEQLPLSHHSRQHPAPFLPETVTGELGPLAIRLPLPPGALMSLHEDEERF